MARSFTIEEGSTYPDMPAMMLATLNALRDLRGSGTVQEIDGRVVENEGIPEGEQAIMTTNGRDRKLNYYLRWARRNLRRGDAVENPSRGVWVLTESGLKIDTPESVKRVSDKVKKEDSEQERRKRATQKTLTPPLQTKEPEDTSQTEGESLDDTDNWKEDLLDILKNMHPTAFEHLAARLLRQAGFTEVKVTRQSRDGGIDGVGVLRVNLIFFRVAFQCKRYQGSVGSPPIRDFRGGLQGKEDKALLITTGGFTSGARREAARAGVFPIDLIDGEQLCDLLKEHGIGTETKMVEKVTIQPEAFEKRA